jgi:hypothetical protein
MSPLVYFVNSVTMTEANGACPSVSLRAERSGDPQSHSCQANAEGIMYPTPTQRVGYNKMGVTNISS